MDLDISMRTVDCFYTVTFYGALFREVESQKGCCSLFIFFVRSWQCVFLGRGVKESIFIFHSAKTVNSPLFNQSGQSHSNLSQSGLEEVMDIKTKTV